MLVSPFLNEHAVRSESVAILACSLGEAQAM